MTTAPARVQKGVPSGGQFAASARGEADISLASAQSAAQRAVEQAYEAGIAEGARRAAGGSPRSLSEVMDLSSVSFDAHEPDAHEDPTVLDPFGDDPWGEAGPTVPCIACGGTGRVERGHPGRACPTCGSTGEMAATPPGQDIVDVPGWGTFHRRRDGIYAGEPQAMRIEASRPLTEDEMTRLAQLVGYKYAAVGRGESMSDFEADSDRSFVTGVDTTKGRAYQRLHEFEDEMDAFIHEGSPERKTNRAGAGTKGTRLIGGLGDPDLRVQVYYDDIVAV